MGEHAGYIVAAYGITVVVILGVIGWTMFDYARLKRALQRFPARGDTDGGA